MGLPGAETADVVAEQEPEALARCSSSFSSASRLSRKWAATLILPAPSHIERRAVGACCEHAIGDEAAVCAAPREAGIAAGSFRHAASTARGPGCWQRTRGHSGVVDVRAALVRILACEPLALFLPRASRLQAAAATWPPRCDARAADGESRGASSAHEGQPPHAASQKHSAGRTTRSITRQQPAGVPRVRGYS